MISEIVFTSFRKSVFQLLLMSVKTFCIGRFKNKIFYNERWRKWNIKFF